MLPAGVSPSSSNDSLQRISSQSSIREIPKHSRQGRLLQRYGEDGCRLVAGTVPMKWNEAGVRTADNVRVMMISSRGGKGMVFPKGGWESDETVEEAAHRETIEEAGVLGLLVEPPLGEFSFKSKKHERLGSAHKGRCVAHMYVLEVTEQLEEWPEHLERQREWVGLEEASRRVRHEWMREALHAWIVREGWTDTMQRIAKAAEENGVATPDRIPVPVKAAGSQADSQLSLPDSSTMVSAATSGVALAQKA
ncbi:uncharacterized protein LOC142358287 [Convolutriloba macropyga]|uniref:uncharacterized protein LOC142358287 n=1 Tax=Convolutriloba macropyga TaxID=536237 RepID=UPI003F520B98